MTITVPTTPSRVPQPVRKVAAGTLMAILLVLTLLVAVLLLVAFRRGQRRRQALRRQQETEHRNAWVEAGRRLATPETGDSETRPGGGT